MLLILAGMVYFVFFTYQNIRHHQEASKWVNHTHEVIEDINAVHASLLQVESQLRGYVITANSIFIKDYNSATATLRQNMDRLQARTNDNPVQVRRTTMIEKLAAQKITFQNQIFRLQQTSPSAAQNLIAGLTGKRLTDSIGLLLQHMAASENSLLVARMQKNDHLTQVRYRTTIAVAVCAFVLLAMLLIKIAAEVKRRRLAEGKALLSEEKYKGLIENSALVVYATDAAGNFTYLSGKCRDLTGYTANELLGTPFLNLVDEAWRPDVQAFYTAQLEKRTFETVRELPLVSKNGELRWLEQSVVLLQSGGRLTGFQGIAKDITQRKYAEELLADAEQRIKAKQEEYHDRLQAILDNMPMIIYLKDLEGRFVMVNRQFHQTFGTTDEQVIGETDVPVHLTKEGAAKFTAADEKIKRTGKPVEIEDLVLTQQGERNMLIIKFPLYSKANELFAISAVGKDVTELMRYQRQLINARQRAEKAERLQEEFLANMSHEIRTPMNGIIGMTNLLETTNPNEEQREYLHMIKESSDILLSLINDILDLSKIKSGRMAVEQAGFDLHQTIENIMAPFRHKAKEKNVQVIKLLQDLPQHIIGDQHKLQQVLNNLLSNAVKFTAQGTVTLYATSEKRSDGSLYLICTVTDTGIGIAPANLEHVFESFVQAGSDMVRRFGGTGLGLAITKRLVELQGGKISGSSTEGEGSSFYVELPVTAGETPQEPRPVKEATFAEAGTGGLSGKHILLVEDNRVNQKVTCLMLQKAGMVVHIANHGKEAIALLENNRYDLIITDLQMPEMDGFQTVAYIRTKLHLNVPVIAMTASALRNEKNRCFEIGMNEYLTKPFTPAVLFQQLQRHLSGSAGQEAAVTELVNHADPAALFNLSYLHEMDDNEYTGEVLQLFLTLTPEALAGMKRATLCEDWSDVHRQAHSLKSSLGILQMNRLLSTVTQIETMAKNRTNTDTIEPLLQQAFQQYDLVKPLLETELQATLQKPVL